MLVRKNTKAFKTILEIFSTCMDRPDREKLIRLFITKAGNTVHDRISIEGIEGNASLFYEMNYQAVLNSLRSPSHQLQESDDVPGLYFFHSASNKSWDETPFEFDEAVKQEFAHLPDLPIVRKKEKVEKTKLPRPASPGKPASKSSGKSHKEAGPVKVKENKAPHYGLRREIEFDFLDKVMFRHPRLSKKDVLDYYDRISDQILPYLKDRPLSLRLHSDIARTQLLNSLEALSNSRIDIPSWIKKVRAPGGDEHVILCNDKEHLLFFVNSGCIEFHMALSKLKTYSMPDYLIFEIDAPGEDTGDALSAARQLREIFNALRLPAFIKTNGSSSLQAGIPLDGKSTYDACLPAAELLCKLLRVKSQGAVSLAGTGEPEFRKVVVNFQKNSGDEAIVAPYSLLQGDGALVSMPLLWDEIEEDIHQKI